MRGSTFYGSWLLVSCIAAAAPAMAQAAGPLKPVTSGVGFTIAAPHPGALPSGGGRVNRPFAIRFVPDAPSTPTSGGGFYETPASLACVYRQGPMPYGCIPGQVTAVASGGSRLIAIVDAYDHPNVVGDLQKYASTFGLPGANLRVVFAAGSRPPQDPTGSWELEEAIDVEMAHALAPGANLVLVEAASASSADLLAAVDVASGLVAGAGGGEVSMSWGGPEFAGEDYYDTHFEKPGVVYFASTGDEPGIEWPSVSSHVVAVGGTSIRRNPGTGVLYGQATWDQGGGGASSYLAAPSFQQALSSVTGSMRAVPDIAAVANPYTPVWAYDSLPVSGYAAGWMLVGGTSVAAPLVAALTNASGTFQPSSVAELTKLYASAGTKGFRPVGVGYCGPGEAYAAAPPWDPCTGLGSPARPQPF